MKPDLVLASVRGYSWEQIRPYVISLERTGCTAQKVMIVDQVSTEAKIELQARAWNVREYIFPAGTMEDFITHHQFIPVVDFLAKTKNDFRYIIKTDVRDIVFQSDPFVWLAKHNHELVAAHESWRVRDEQYVSGAWRASSYPPGAVSWLLNEQTINSGELAGTPKIMARLWADVLALARPGSNDQSTVNYLLRTPAYKGKFVISPLDDGWAVCCAPFRTEQFRSEIDFNPALFTDTIPVFDKAAGMVYTTTGVPFCIVHMYDRDPEWTKIMQEKYR